MSETAAHRSDEEVRPTPAGEVLLEVRELETTFYTDAGPVRAVDHVSFEIRRGEALALVGESGCGKSVTAMSILRLISPPGKITGGAILYNGKDLLTLPEKEMRSYRGRQIAIVFQEPMTSLNPVIRVGDQIAEAIRIHEKVGRKEALKRAAEMLDLVSIPDPVRRLDDYPHQMSGGMRQRVMIAMALSCRPDLLIADEPTTALDVTIQAQILELLAGLREQLGLTVLLITHDLGIVAEFCERALVMYTGRVVEQGPVRSLFADPLHPYTRGLLRSLPAARKAGTQPQRLIPIVGMVPDLRSLPTGCTFHPRCPEIMERCRAQVPALSGTGHRVRCFLHDDEVEETR